MPDSVTASQAQHISTDESQKPRTVEPASHSRASLCRPINKKSWNRQVCSQWKPVRALVYGAGAEIAWEGVRGAAWVRGGGLYREFHGDAWLWKLVDATLRVGYLTVCGCCLDDDYKLVLTRNRWHASVKWWHPYPPVKDKTRRHAAEGTKQMLA